MQEKQAIEYWKKAREFLAEVLSPDIYERWIGVIDASGDDLGDSQLTLTVPNDFYQDWLVENFMSHIRKALSAAGCENPTIHFAVDASRQLREMPEERLPGGVPPAAPAKTSARKASVRSCNVGSPLNPKNTFENFVVGPSNTFAHAAALAVVEAPGRAYNPLFIHGGTGLGKTHLIQAMGDALLKRKKGTVCYISSEKFTNEYIQAIQEHAIADFRRKYRNIDMLLIDDIHFLAGKEGIQEEFFHTFNSLYENQKQIVLTSDRPVSEIANLQKRLVSRFEWGLVTEMEMANLETRVAILRRKREQMDLQVPDDALFFIAEHIRSNIRKL